MAPSSCILPKHVFMVTYRVYPQQRMRFRLISMFTGRSNYKNHRSNIEPIDKTSSDNYDRLQAGLRTFTVVVATAYCVTRFLGEPILLQGPSMEPTIQDNDVIIAEKYTSTFGKYDYQRGDIVVVRSPVNPHQLICKRIAALPGEPVNSRFNLLSRQNTVPQGHVWLLGDNKSNSTDSREFGSLPMGLIIGRVIFRVWPLDRWTDFRNDSGSLKYTE